MKGEAIFFIKLLNRGSSPEALKEVHASAYALREKSLGNQNATYTFEVDASGFPTATNWTNYLRTTMPSAIDIIKEVSNSTRDVGVYVVAHSSSATIAGMTGGQLAELIKGLGFINIR